MNLHKTFFGHRQLKPVDAEIIIVGKEFKARLPNGSLLTARMEQDAGDSGMAIEFFDGIFGFMIGNKVIFTSIME